MKLFEGGIQELTELLNYAGISEESRWKLHNRLESTKPEKHKALLEALGMEEKEVIRIREWAVKTK